MVRIYTLVNGEQIIGKQSDTTHSYVSSSGETLVFPDRARETTTKIEDPYYIMESEDQYGNSGMKLINVCTFSKEQCIIVNDTHIVFSIEANEKMTEYYQKLVAAHDNKDTSTMIEDAIKDMESMEDKMREIITNRLVGGSTIN